VIPCYQICKDRNCSHWSPDLLDCPLLPDNCDYAVEHLVRDGRELNQYIDGKEHGKWRWWYENGNRWLDTRYILGKEHGRSRWWYEIGQLQFDGNYINGKKHGLFKHWRYDGRLMSKEYYENGVKQ